MSRPRHIPGLRFPRRVGRLAGAARAYLAGIGTSGSLLAGAALMFFVASALVAFRGWPHVAAQPSPGEVVVAPRPAVPTASPVARRLRLITAPAAGAVARARANRPAVGTRGVTGGAPAGGPPATRQSIGTPVSVSRPGAPAASPVRGTPTALAGCAGGGCGSTPAPSAPVHSAPTPTTPTTPTTPVAPVLQKVGGTLGTVVSNAGSAVGSTVQQTTNTAAGAVQGVSPQVGGAVSQVGSGTANAIGGVTKTVSGVLSGLGQ